MFDNISIKRKSMILVVIVSILLLFQCHYNGTKMGNWISNKLYIHRFNEFVSVGCQYPTLTAKNLTNNDTYDAYVDETVLLTNCNVVVGSRYNGGKSIIITIKGDDKNGNIDLEFDPNVSFKPNLIRDGDIITVIGVVVDSIHPDIGPMRIKQLTNCALVDVIKEGVII